MALPFVAHLHLEQVRQSCQHLQTARDDTMDTNKTGKVHKLNALTAIADAQDCFFPDFSTPGN